MEPITIIKGTVMPLDRDDVDTDQIMPKQFLKRTERTGWGEFLFDTWRTDPQFVFNDERYQGASILVAGANFGSGSSREQATWAVLQYGFRAVIAPSYSDIFALNATQIGLLAITLDPHLCRELLNLALNDPASVVAIDLAEQRITFNDRAITFDIDRTTKKALLLGLDDIDLIRSEAESISEYEVSQPDWLPRVRT